MATNYPYSLRRALSSRHPSLSSVPFKGATMVTPIFAPLERVPDQPERYLSPGSLDYPSHFEVLKESLPLFAQNPPGTWTRLPRALWIGDDAPPESMAGIFMDQIVWDERPMDLWKPEDNPGEAVDTIETELSFSQLPGGTKGPSFALAQPQRHGISIFVTTPWPHQVQRTIAKVLDIPTELVSVNALDGGAQWGSSIVDSLRAALYAGIGARHWKKSCYCSWDGLAIHHRGFEPNIHIKTWVGAAGTLIKEEIRIQLALSDNFIGEQELKRALTAGPFHHFRAAGGSILWRHGVAEGVFEDLSHPWVHHWLNCAREIHMNRIAKALGQDPVKLRITSVNRTIKGASELVKLLEEGRKMSDFSRRYGASALLSKESTQQLYHRDDFGCAFSGVPNGLSRAVEAQLGASIRLLMHKDSKVEVQTMLSDESPSKRDFYRSTVSEILEVAEEDVSLHSSQTHYSPDPGPELMGRALWVLPYNLELAANQVRKKRFRVGLPIEVKKRFSSTDSRFSSEKSRSWVFCAARVQRSLFAGRVIQVVLWILLDGGRILHPAMAKAGVGGEVQRTLNQALGVDHRRVHRVHVNFLPPKGSAQPKGVGSSCSGAVAAAVTSALTHGNPSFFYPPESGESP